MQALSEISCNGHSQSASHLAKFMLGMVFGKPHILKHSPLIFAKYLHDTVISVYRNSYSVS
jgi:hypothetical protein